MGGGGAGAREDCRELSREMVSIGFCTACFGCFRGFEVGVGLCLGDGSALERIELKAIGSVGLLGVCDGSISIGGKNGYWNVHSRVVEAPA